MATIKPTLQLTSNAASATTLPGPLSFALSLSVTDSLTVDTVESEIFTIGTGANTTIIDGSTIESAFVPGDLTRSHADSHRTFALLPGEFAFFPFDYCGDIVAQATAADQTLEFFRFDRG